MRELISRIICDFIVVVKLHDIVPWALVDQKIIFRGLYRKEVKYILGQLHEKFKYSYGYRIYLLVLLFVAGKKICYILEDIDKNMIGVVLFYFNFWDIHHRTIHLGGYFVSDAYVGKGWGSILLENIFDNLRIRFSFRGISAKVSIHNSISYSLLRKFNFQKIEDSSLKIQKDEHFLVLYF